MASDNWSHLLVLLRHAEALEKLGNYAEAVEALRLLAEASDEHRIPARNRIMKIESEHLLVPHNRTDIDAGIISFFEDLERSNRVKVITLWCTPFCF